MTLPVEIQAARLKLVKSRPYLAAALWALRPVEKPGLGTMAVDQYWRLYYDPAVTAAWSTDEIAGVLYHEVMHLLRDHPGRFANCDPRLANIATDAEINDDLLQEGVILPLEPVTPEAIGQPENRLAEEYYNALASQVQSESESANGQASAPESGHENKGGQTSAREGEQKSEGGQASAREGGQEDGSSGGGDGAGDAPQSPSESNRDGGGDAADQQSGDASGSTPDASSQSGQSASSQAASSPAGNDSAGGHDAAPNGPSGQMPAGSSKSAGSSGFEQPRPGAGHCGSAATGTPAAWEDPAPTDGEGVSRSEAEIIRRQVAQAIREHVRNRSDVPGGLARWADEKLEPKADWRRVLARHIRRAIADKAGAVDYTYAKPSRRQSGNVIMPRLRQPSIQPAVVIDSSGSIDDGMLSQALAETKSILRAAGHNDIPVLTVSTGVESMQRVRRVSQIKAAGGGGTDMRAGINAALKIRPRPSVIIVITDGLTPWPDTQPPVDVIVALTENNPTPSWAKRVEVWG